MFQCGKKVTFESLKAWTSSCYTVSVGIVYWMKFKSLFFLTWRFLASESCDLLLWLVFVVRRHFDSKVSVFIYSQIWIWSKHSQGTPNLTTFWRIRRQTHKDLRQFANSKVAQIYFWPFKRQLKLSRIWDEFCRFSWIFVSFMAISTIVYIFVVSN